MKTINRKKGAQKRVSKRNGILTPRTYREKIRAEIEAMFPEGRATYSFKLPAIYTAVSMKTHQQPVVLGNRLLNLTTNRYVTAPEQLWLVESIVGSTLFGEVLLKHKTLNDSFFELLFSRAGLSFYLDASDTWLVGYNDELTRADYGPLTPISVLEAVRQFGLSAVEQAKEKTAVRL